MMSSITVWRCTNCGWEGTYGDMQTDNIGSHSCPDCLAYFNTEGDSIGPWEIAEVIPEDVDNTDYGDF